MVGLSAEERERLEGLRRKGEIPATRLTKVQILLKADISEAGEGWSDSEIVKALDTTASMVYRTRRQLVEEGLDAVLERFPAELNRKGIRQIEGNLIDDLRRLEAARDGSVVFGFTQEGDFGGH